MDNKKTLSNLSESRGLAVLILELFEEMLCEKDIVIPDEDRTGAEDEANLYGMTYAVLEDRIASLLTSETVEPSYALADGVRCMGETPTGIIRLLIHYPEADCMPEMLDVPLTLNKKEAVLVAFRNAINQTRGESSDRLTRLDMVIADMERDLGTKITAYSLDAVDEIEG